MGVASSLMHADAVIILGHSEDKRAGSTEYPPLTMITYCQEGALLPSAVGLEVIDGLTKNNGLLPEVVSVQKCAHEARQGR